MKRFVILCTLIFAVAVSQSATIRQPAVAGQFYPADSAELRGAVESFLGKVSEPAIEGRLIALVVPHAGYPYSGPVAAYSYKLLQDSGIKKVILCGPSHYVRYQGVSVYGPGIIWKTPLGNVACDDSLCNKVLAFNELFAVASQPHEREHSLEVQVPFLQTVLKDFRIVPLVMGTQSAMEIDLTAKALASLKLDNHSVMIASSDWQHYRPAKEGYKMDSLGMDCLDKFKIAKLQQYLSTGQVEMCGGGPVLAVLKAAKAMGADKVKILRYGDSGDITGDKSTVVGYVAAAIYKSSSPTKKTDPEKQGQIEKTPEEQSTALSAGDKKMLLEIARRSIESYLAKGTVPDFDVSERLKAPGAAFVTLNENGQLRGCIGYTIAVEPLYKTVSDCAVKAAVSDPRFVPVVASEVPKLKLEISVLTPLVQVESLDDIQVGRDGLMISLGNNRGLLLPQVATDYGWNRTQFLEQTCEKAGLPSDAYKNPDAVIHKFQALVFGE